MATQEAHFDHTTLARRRWRVVGQVQGVGFRPFVYRIAAELKLTGFVRNDPGGVAIEAQGPAEKLDRFARMLAENRPPLAAITGISCADARVRDGERAFGIELSDHDEAVSADVTVDTATCPDCVSELFDADDRRQGYGLINCTNCGPRFTIIRHIPYDRPNTTMAEFGMCDPCRAEYHSPGDRRFHAQPIACHDCGPKVSLAGPKGNRVDGDPIASAADRLIAGQILAIKGLGGFHLAVRADDSAAVTRLRDLKQRDRKPFAIMVRNLEEARRLVEISDAAAEAMTSPASPIILAPRRHSTSVAPDVAPGNRRLGVMLPYTPIQHLLFSALSSQRSTPALVMTSANLSDEPLVIDNDEATERLGGICDAILWHDRPIERPVDDSVLIDLGKRGLLPIRRARGYVPRPINLSRDAGMGLCVGGELKNTIAVVRGERVVLSHHLGDLTHAKAYASFRKAITDLCELFAIRPQWIAHDLHPMYLSTAYAKQLAAELDVPLIGVQHHHAHAAAVMAENGVEEKVLAVVCDGVGYATDGTIWGGELLEADLRDFNRLAHLEPLPLPGGDAAAKDCRRCGLALLNQAFGPGFLEHPMAQKLVPDAEERAVLGAMILRRFNCAISSGAGRYFDGIAALLGICQRNSFEAEAAMAMESLASQRTDVTGEENLFDLRGQGPVRISFAPLVHSLLEKLEAGEDAARLAAIWHVQFARAWEKVVVRESARTGIETVALSGGVFCNQRLTELLADSLEKRGLRVLRHRVVPPNDGGLSLGQAAVAIVHRSER